MAEKRISSCATAQVTLEIRGLGSWGKECQIDQVYRQAKITAMEKIKSKLSYVDFSIVGEPIIKAIVFEEE